ncbi:MAG: hypothetical protein ACRDKT_16820, partial [Actinomycetota bacterium]
MSDQRVDAAEPKRRVNWWLLGAGMTLFGIGDFVYFFAAAESRNPTGGLILIGLTIALAAILFPVHRSLSLGIAAGYVVMTIVSAGECTWTFEDPLSTGQGAVAALLL